MAVETMGPSAQAAVASAFTKMGASGPRTILSVYPKALEHSLMHEGRKIYRIEAAEKGSYSLLVVPDTGAALRSPMGAYYVAPIPASVVADNLVDVWAKGRHGASAGFMPGIVHVESATPSTPTEEDIQRAYKKAVVQQDAYCRFLVNDADAKFVKEGSINILDEHRWAAEWMGLKDRKWSQPMEPIALDKCPACAEEIKSGAVICRWCRTDIEKFRADRAVVSVDATPEEAPKRTKKG
jgi:hypothetical protein